MKRLTTCPHCEATNSFDATALRLSPTKEFECGACHHVFLPKAHKKGRSDSQRRSKDQEEKAAKRYGARRQAGSGTSSRAKGDIQATGVLLGECKETTAKSYSLKLEELMKIEKEARGSEQPLFEVQFQGVHPFKTYVVLPAKDYAAMQEELEYFRQGE